MFLSVTRDLDNADDVIHSVGMSVGNTPKCSFIVSFGSTALISAANEVWLSRKLNLAHGVSLNLYFGQ